METRKAIKTEQSKDTVSIGHRTQNKDKKTKKKQKTIKKREKHTPIRTTWKTKEISNTEITRNVLE